MNHAIKTISRRTLVQMSNENNCDVKQVINELKKTLALYSNSQYIHLSWKIKTEKSNDKSVSFSNYMEYGMDIVELIKLFTLIRLQENYSDFSMLKELKSGLDYLQENSMQLHNLSKEIFTLQYTDYLSKRYKNESTKSRHFNTFKKFLYYMQGHPNIPNLLGIELVESPFSNKNGTDSRYKVIEPDVLNFLDNHFKLRSTHLVHRTAYWILRLYATRPDETLNYPLNCVEKLNDDIAIIRAYVGKESTKIFKKNGEKFHTLLFLDLKDSSMKYLYELIKEQQVEANKLQHALDKKGYLFTYRPYLFHGGCKRTSVFSTQALENYMRKIQRENNIPESKRARPRDFKKTGITQRAEWGFNSFDLKKMANHNGFESLDAYSSPSPKFISNKQRETLKFEGKLSERFMFRGKIINGIDDVVEKKIMQNPRAHKLPDMGYCPDVNHCGNHFECLGCKDLIPDKELEDYYYEQGMVHLEKTKNQERIGDKINAKDSLHRATLFHNLWQKVRSNHGKR